MRLGHLSSKVMPSQHSGQCQETKKVKISVEKEGRKRREKEGKGEKERGKKERVISSGPLFSVLLKGKQQLFPSAYSPSVI